MESSTKDSSVIVNKKNCKFINKEIITELFWDTQEKVTTIPKCIFKFQNLTKLTLINNNIREIPKSILKLTKLEELNLSKNKLNSFPLFLSELNHLKTLNLDINQIVSPINKMYKKFVFHSLKELRIGANKIQRLDWLDIFPNLEKLFAYELILNTKYSLAKIDTLKKLDLDNCKFSDNSMNNVVFIPMLNNLEWLLMRNTGISSLHSIPSLPNLKYLLVQDNKIELIDDDIARFPKLIWVILVNNNIKRIKVYKHQLPDIKLLNLRGNPIFNLPDAIITDIDELKVENINE